MQFAFSMVKVLQWIIAVPQNHLQTINASINPLSGNYVWVSEGDRALTAVPPRIIDPFIREVSPDGSHLRSILWPSAFKMSTDNKGPRGNAVFEGLTFLPDGSKLAVLAEGPLQEDGPAPTVDAGATARLTVITHATGAMAQYAYPIERVQAAPVPAGSFTVNGPSELLALTATRFLVLERSFSVGVVGNQVRLYEIDLTGASNVLNVPALSGEPFTPVSKRLILDFETLKDTLGGIANLECLTFGPKLANGHDSLVVVADDNFPTADSPTDRNQFLVFEVIP